MNSQFVAALTLLAACANASLAAGPASESDESLDEIIVAERTTRSNGTRIDVADQLLVDTAMALKELPGASVNQNGALTGIAQYRGMYGDRVAVTIDNHSIVSGGPNAMDAPLSYISPMLADSIVLDRGIASVSSSPESIGGHVNASLNRGRFGGDEFRMSGFAGSRYSSNGDITTSAARLTVSDSTHRVLLLTEVDSGNDISTALGTIRPSRLNRDRYDLSYGFTDGDNHVVLFAGRLTTENSGTPALAMDIGSIDTDLLGAHFLYRVSSSLNIEGRVSMNEVDHTMDNFTLRQAPPAAMQRVNSATADGQSFAVAANIARERASIRFGLDGVLANHDSTITNPNNTAFQIQNFSNIHRDLLSAFAEWSIELASSTVELGVRYKRVDTDSGRVSSSGIAMPAAAMLQDAFNNSDSKRHFDDYDVVAKYRYRSSEQIEWQFGVARKSRAPSYQELYLWLPLQATGGLADGRNYVGDRNLDSEYSNEMNLGFALTTSRLSLSPQLFLRSVDGYIQGVPSPNNAANMMSTMMSGQPALQFANTDARIWGADIDWSYALSDEWTIDGVFSTVLGERRDIADNLYRLAPGNANIRIGYRRNAWSTSAGLFAYAKADRVSETNDETTSPGYAIINTEFNWQASEAVKFEARIHNLLDRSYIDHLAGVNRAMGSDIGINSRLPGPERMLTIGAILNF
ncbi:MAG TPA: TonB-dependent receptor [Woeseiaceae bacterium]|nr:TonB-dependent receptor [Woeseiaceae bacterium]